MSEVALQIGGRTYRVACAPGEEERVTGLGATIADKLAAMGNPAGPDAQNLLFAALLLADEVHEGRETVSSAEEAISTARREADAANDELARLKARIGELEDELGSIRASRAELEAKVAEHEAHEATLRDAIADLEEAQRSRPSAPPANQGDANLSAIAPALEHFAEMLEECADKLEGRVATA